MAVHLPTSNWVNNLWESHNDGAKSKRTAGKADNYRFHAISSTLAFNLTLLRFLLKNTCWYNFPHSGKVVPISIKAYGNVFRFTGTCLKNSETIPKLNCSSKRKFLHAEKKFITWKPNTCPSPKNADSTVANHTKTSEIPPVALIGGLCKTRSLMCWKLVEVHAKSKSGWDMKICYFCEFLHIDEFCPKWANLFATISRNLLHRIHHKWEQESDFKDVVAAKLIRS